CYLRYREQVGQDSAQLIFDEETANEIGVDDFANGPTTAGGAHHLVRSETIQPEPPHHRSS
ncbi:MAG: hypothetical protein AAF236_13770, partial [Verrucomicrobiota bacterium]